MNALIAYTKADPMVLVLLLVAAVFGFIGLGLALTLRATKGKP